MKKGVTRVQEQKTAGGSALKAGIAKKNGAMMMAADQPQQPGGPRTVSDLLLSCWEKYRRRKYRIHPYRTYAAALRDLDFLGRHVLGVGANAVAIELVNGTVFKVTTNFLRPDMGTRPFEIPILERNTRELDGGFSLSYFTQPMTCTPVSTKEWRAFRQWVQCFGYLMSGGCDDLGIYDGQVRLLDPWAVEKIN